MKLLLQPKRQTYKCNMHTLFPPQGGEGGRVGDLCDRIGTPYGFEDWYMLTCRQEL